LVRRTLYFLFIADPSLCAPPRQGGYAASFYGSTKE
jgi:hypothetical protein